MGASNGANVVVMPNDDDTIDWGDGIKSPGSGITTGAACCDEAGGSQRHVQDSNGSKEGQGAYEVKDSDVQVTSQAPALSNPPFSITASNGDNGRGLPYYRGETPEGQKLLWQARIVRLAHEILKADPEYHKGHLQFADIASPLQAEIFAAIHTHSSMYAVYEPPAWMDEDEQWAGIRLAVEAAWEDFRAKERNELILALQTEVQLKLPELITPNIQVLSAKEFAVQQRAIRREWVIDGFLAKREISLWSGKVEHGKTTLIRTLVMCLLTGEQFLERHVYPGKVLYVMLDADGAALTFEQFSQLGVDWDNEPNLDLLVDPIMCFRPNAFQQFHRELLDRQPSIVVIDPIGRFKKIEAANGSGGFNGYEMTYVMAEFTALAQQTNCHMVLLHHIPRGRNDNDDPATAAFGSVAIAGGANARFTCLKKPGDVFCLITSKGKGGGFKPFEGAQKLDLNPDTGWVTLAGAFDWKDQARGLKPAVYDLIAPSDETFTAAAIAKILGVARSVCGLAAKMLVDEGRIMMKQERTGGRPMDVFFRRVIS